MITVVGTTISNFFSLLYSFQIHGTTGNPLTLLARDAKNKMTPQGTGVKMLVGDMKEANGSADERVREIFDDMLERGVS